MNSIILKISTATFFLLIFGTLGLAASNDPVCVPGDTKCLHPKQPMEPKTAVIQDREDGLRVTRMDYDEDNDDADDVYNNDNDFQERVDRDREREHEWREDRDDQGPIDRDHVDRDLHIDVGR